MARIGDVIESYEAAVDGHDARTAEAEAADVAKENARLESEVKEADLRTAIRSRPEPDRKIFYVRVGEPRLYVPDESENGFHVEKVDTGDAEVDDPAPPE